MSQYLEAQNYPIKINTFAAYQLTVRRKPFKALLLFFLLCFSFHAFASHIKGGYIQYQYMGVGSSAGTSKYQVNITIFYNCGVNGPRTPISLLVFNAATNASVQTVSIAAGSNSTITKSSINPCMVNPPTICYEVYNYSTTITLTDNTSGYILSVVDQYRTASIINIPNSSSAGIAFTATIPGTINTVDYHTNTSPTFAFKDTAIICYNGSFEYQFSASDTVDNDSLSYSFGPGLNYTTSSAPPYNSLTYNSGYSGTSPMGSGVTINPVTGLISGTAPTTTGQYVIAVYVTEWRNGVAINSTKKELQIYVYNCSLTSASLDASYINCNSFSFTFQNESTASSITGYYWDFGVLTSTKDTSTQAVPTYVYADTGSYTVKLKVTNSSGCSDSTTAPLKVYPGFTPNFTFMGSCYASAFYFKDATIVKYGSVNSWSWDFGDLSTTTDTSTIKNPSYTYPSAGTRTVLLTVGSDKGCSDTITKTVVANDKPAIVLPFHDTLICSNDTLPLIVQSTGTFLWTPNYNIKNPTATNPSVWPQDTTTYTVTVTDGGCVSSDSIKVNVLQFITVDAGNDTTLCQTDSIILRPISYALSYVWTPAATLSSGFVKNPKASPAAIITYYVTANLGHCQDHDSVKVYVSPYPKANAGNDTTICYGASAQLNGTITGAYFSWSPLATLTNANTLTPTASPLATTSYLLTVKDTFYCPKPFIDTVIVTVVPQVMASAGNDTSVVLGQPLQLEASGALTYVWTPSTWLSSTTIQNPIATITSPIDSIRYYVTAYTATGCNATGSVLVKVYTTGPDIFVPTGFTPNSDGKNDVLKPILVGITTLHYFKVYNRFGQLIFSTSQANAGWDGRINGELQPTGSYLYMAQGVDYTGKVILRQGTTILIR